jgi:hypothetical protein
VKQVNIAHQEAEQELLAVSKWTIQMLDQGGLVYGGNTLTSNGFDEFHDWAAAVRAAVAKAEIAEDSTQSLKRTHADVQLPQLKDNEVFKQTCVVK